MSNRGYLPNSPPQSHSGPSSHRRQRPSLPQHFVQPMHTPDQSDSGRVSSDPGQVLARRANSPSSSRTYHPPFRHSSLRYQSDSPSNRVDNAELVRSSSVRSRDIIERRNGVESALSRYDGRHSSGTRQYESIRNKHSSWSTADEIGQEPMRSQSVAGGIYDPCHVGLSRSRNRTRASLSPLASRYVGTRRPFNEEYCDDDDGQFSATTYNNSHTVARTAGSGGSRGLSSEWGHEPDPEAKYRRFTSPTGNSRKKPGPPVPGADHVSSRLWPANEAEGTVRRSGGARGGSDTFRPSNNSPSNPISWESRQHRHSGEHASSSSGGSSRRDPGPQRSVRHVAPVIGHRDSPHSAMNMSDSANRQVRPHTQASSVGPMGGSVATLSPTPSVEHHRLLISAFEALGRSQDSQPTEPDDLVEALIGLLSSVVKNSCRVDATLKELIESGLNARVELELVDHERSSPRNTRFEPHQRNPTQGPSPDGKQQILEECLAHIHRTHNQLLRTSNSQIRDLTEVLISLNKLHRSRRELLETRRADSAGYQSSGGRDRRDSLHFSERHLEEINRRSPAKIRRSVGVSPLSAISSQEESPLSRVLMEGREPTVKRDAARESPHSSPLRPVRLQDHPSQQQHHRSSTISFSHDRRGSRLAERHKMEPGSRLSMFTQSFSQSHRPDSPGPVNQADTAPVGPRPHRRGMRQNRFTHTGEFGTYRRSDGQTLNSAEGSTSHDEELLHQSTGPASAWEAPASSLRGSQSGIVFPRTPSGLATSSISQMTAHSNVSPTKIGSGSVGRSLQRNSSVSEQSVRPQSSLSHILDRANSVLSRAGHLRELKNSFT